MATTLAIRVEGPDQAGEARRAAAAMAARSGFDETGTARAALVATECATNLWKHGKGGELLLSPIDTEADPAIEILALDKGPGMSNPGACFEDGYSTAGSQGIGLGAIDRLSECEVYTAAGRGTALLARLHAHRNGSGVKPAARLIIGAVSVPKPGEDVCGDSWAVRHFAEYSSVLVVDGLGHGPAAAQTAMAATEAFNEYFRGEPAEILGGIDGALRSTRGAAVAVLRFDHDSRIIRWASIGNVAGVVCGPAGCRHFVCQPGIVGHRMGSVHEYTYGWDASGPILLYSDGIATHWSPDSYGDLFSRDPSLVAGVIYRDWTRGRDDATVVVLRLAGI